MPLALKHSLLILAVLMFCIQNASSIDVRDAEETPWQQVKEDEGIIVYAKRTQQYAKFRGVGRITVNDPHVIIALMEDFKNTPTWFALLSELNELERVDDFNRYYQGIVSFPIIQDREVVFKLTVSQDPKSDRITAKLSNQYDYIPINSQYIRFPFFEGLYKLDVISNTEIEVTYELSSYPGGYISADIADYFSKYTPYLTIKGMREAVKNPKYHNRAADFPYFSFKTITEQP